MVVESQMLLLRCSENTLCSFGAPGGVVVMALRYKSEGRGFDSRWCNWNFSVT